MLRQEKVSNMNTNTKVQNPRKAGRKIYCRGTAFTLNRRILDHLYTDLEAGKITALLLLEIARDMRKALSYERLHKRIFKTA